MTPSSAEVPEAPSPPMTRAASSSASVGKNDDTSRQDGKADANVGIVSAATSVTAVDTRASTPTQDQQQQKKQAESEPSGGQEGNINGGSHSSASSLSSPSASASASASLSSSDFDAVSSAAASASASIDCSSLDLDAALIEVIAARAAAAATAAVFGRGLCAAEGVDVDEAAAEEAASLVSSNDGDACGGEMMVSRKEDLIFFACIVLVS